MGQTLPIRGVGDVGVLTDVAPANLPPQAFTRAKNVRFDEGAVVRAPVFRKVKESLGFNPRFSYGTIPSSGHGTVLMVSDTYVIKEYANGSTTDRSGSISAMASNQAPFTGSTLANITYFNRNDRIPVYRINGGTNFADIPNQSALDGANWVSSWRTESLRSYGDFLIALNMIEGSSSYPTRVRWSNLALANNVPDSWYAADTTKSAGFNDLVQMKTGIVDGATLGSNFIIYSKDQVWLMEFVGGTFIFNFRKLFSETGLINANCALEVQNKHFCFGTDDIYTHDGNSKVSIADERVKSYIFNGISTDKLDRCFVHHNPLLEEIYFCYSSGDDMSEFTNGDRCNRAAVYNYKNNTWSFLDLPNVSSATLASLASTSTYQNVVGTYATIGGTYHSQEAGFSLHNIFVGEDSASDGITSDKLYGLDGSEDNTLLSFPVDTVATKAPFIERVGIDLDDSVPLSGYKVITKVVPQIHTDNSNKEFSFNFGAADLITSATAYESTVTFDASVSHKIDTRAAGRYLSYKMTLSDTKDFRFLGFDVELTATGRR